MHNELLTGLRHKHFEGDPRMVISEIFVLNFFFWKFVIFLNDRIPQMGCLKETDLEQIQLPLLRNQFQLNGLSSFPRLLVVHHLCFNGCFDIFTLTLQVFGGEGPEIYTK